MKIIVDNYLFEALKPSEFRGLIKKIINLQKKMLKLFVKYKGRLEFKWWTAKRGAR